MINYKKRKAWNELTKFIRENRKEGRADFQVLTTADKLIIIAEDEDRKETIRIKY